MALLLIEPPPPSKGASFDGWMSRLWQALRSGQTQVSLGADVSGTLPVANGGTGSTTATDARTALDVPKRDGTNASGTWGIAISGNAATVTNGLYSTGSYANPAWITSIDVSKVSGLTSGKSLFQAANTPPTVSGIRGTNAALANLLSTLATAGLITDSTTET